MKTLEIGETIAISHNDNYPYDLLPEGSHFEHLYNDGNQYDGFISVLEVVED